MTWGNRSTDLSLAQQADEAAMRCRYCLKFGHSQETCKEKQARQIDNLRWDLASLQKRVERIWISAFVWLTLSFLAGVAAGRLWVYWS